MGLQLRTQMKALFPLKQEQAFNLSRKEIWNGCLVPHAGFNSNKINTFRLNPCLDQCLNQISKYTHTQSNLQKKTGGGLGKIYRHMQHVSYFDSEATSILFQQQEDRQRIPKLPGVVVSSCCPIADRPSKNTRSRTRIQQSTLTSREKDTPQILASYLTS